MTTQPQHTIPVEICVEIHPNLYAHLVAHTIRSRSDFNRELERAIAQYLGLGQWRDAA